MIRRPCDIYHPAEETTSGTNREQPGAHQTLLQEHVRSNTGGEGSSSQVRGRIRLHDPILDAESKNSLVIRLCNVPAPISLPLSDEVGIDTIHAAQRDFFQAIPLVVADGRQLSTNDAVRITNFFFNYCIGPPLLDRLWKIAEAQNLDPRSHRLSADEAWGDRTVDNDMPNSLYRLGASMLALESPDAPPPIRPIFEMLALVQLVLDHDTLAKELDTLGCMSPAAMYLHRKGYQPRKKATQGQPRTWISTARQYLEDSLELGTGRIRRTYFNKAYSYVAIVREFGPGVLLLLGVKTYVALPSNDRV